MVAKKVLVFKYSAAPFILSAFCPLLLLVLSFESGFIDSTIVADNPAPLANKLSGVLITKSRYRAGLICQDKGWEFCARWAKSRRSPGSLIA
ncbi:MAG: hypothetical protein ACI8SJ_002632 [Shewanella sp.]|jgi:hypothetical protein